MDESCFSVSRLLLLLRISRTLDLHLGHGSFDSLEIVGSQLHIDCADVFLQAMQLGCARDRCNPGLLCQKPGDGNLRTGCMLVVGDIAEQLDQRLIGLPRLSLEARKHIANVVAFANFVFSLIAPVKKPLPSGLKGTKPMPSSSSVGRAVAFR